MNAPERCADPVKFFGLSGIPAPKRGQRDEKSKHNQYNKTDMKKLAIIRSEFNKNMVDLLYRQARKEFDLWRVKTEKAKKDFSSQDSPALSLPFDNRKPENPAPTSPTHTIQTKSQDNISPVSPSPLTNKPFKVKSPPQNMNWREISFSVPGAGEIPLAVKWAIESKNIHAVLALGVILRGQTSHYDFLCGFLQRALWDLQNNSSLPIVFSVLMSENKQQARERIEKGRGSEGMKSLIKMIHLKQEIQHEMV